MSVIGVLTSTTGEDNTYILSRVVGNRNIVIISLPDGDADSTAYVVSQMLSVFQSIEIGVNGWNRRPAPTSERDIRPGDIVVRSARGQD